MKILINASNLKKGGGLQVADSICSLLYKFSQHQFVVVLSKYLEFTVNKIDKFDNVELLRYDLPKNIWIFLSGRNTFLDDIVVSKQIDAVITIFGPSLWIPTITHISGFARPHCVLTDSPYLKKMPLKASLKNRIERRLLLWAFGRCSKIYFTENQFISKKLELLFPSKKIYTITNYYNQIFDLESQWSNNILLSTFTGITLLTISANYPHKNLSIIIPTIHFLHNKYPDLDFRFVLTIDRGQFPPLTDDEEKHIIFLGSVPLSECPNLYKQCTVVFSPTLLECFSAVYPEAMRMEKPIITTDLDFSRSLCGNAALYYDALSHEALGECIFRISTDKEMNGLLINEGKKQLMTYDNYEERINKLIALVELEFSNHRK